MATRTDKLPNDIRWCVTRKRIPLAWSAHYDSARLICCTWHNLFGACLVVDDKRLEAIIFHLIDADRSVEQVLAAIRAYHRHVLTDPYYRQENRAKPNKPAGTVAHKDLVRFLTVASVFDRFFEEGIAETFEAKRDSALSTQDSALSPAAESAVYAEFLNAPHGRRLDLINRAERELQDQGRKITHDARRAIIVRILRSQETPLSERTQS